jgi:hypothetical protein
MRSARAKMGRQGDGELELALLAVGEGGGDGVGATEEAEGGAGAGLDGEGGVLQRRDAGDDAGDLEEAGHPEAGAARNGSVGDVAAGEQDGAAGGMVPADQAHQCGFAGAVGADDGVDLIRLDGQGGVVGGSQAAERLWRLRSSSRGSGMGARGDASGQAVAQE